MIYFMIFITPGENKSKTIHSRKYNIFTSFHFFFNRFFCYKGEIFSFNLIILVFHIPIFPYFGISIFWHFDISILWYFNVSLFKTSVFLFFGISILHIYIFLVFCCFHILVFYIISWKYKSFMQKKYLSRQTWKYQVFPREKLVFWESESWNFIKLHQFHNFHKNQLFREKLDFH